MTHRFRGATALALALFFALTASPPVDATHVGAHDAADPVQSVLAAARSHLGASYQFGGTGPRFDCSGLVFRVFKETGELSRIGGHRRTAAQLLRWFRARGWANAHDGRPGDLVIYNNGTHVGIYVGHGKVISAIDMGVRKLGLHRLTIPFTVFLHTHLGGDPPAVASR